MYIVRWLMGHPIIATWVLAAIAILLTFSSGNNSDKKEILVEEKKPVSEQLKEVKAGINSKMDDGKIISKPVLDVGSTTGEVEPKVNKNMATTTDTVIDSNKKAVKAVKSLVNAGSEVDSLAIKNSPFGATDATLKKDNVDMQTKTNKGSELSTAVTDLGQSTTEEMLLMAREAYWNNGLDEAAQIYEKLIEVEPKVLEHRGELGNVYWRQGYPKKAAELYSEIAIPMIEQGGKERVANMIGFIGLFYPDRAAEIHKQIQLKK